MDRWYLKALTIVYLNSEVFESNFKVSFSHLALNMAYAYTLSYVVGSPSHLIHFLCFQYSVFRSKCLMFLKFLFFFLNDFSVVLHLFVE